MSSDIRCVHVMSDDEPDKICDVWEKNVAGPLRAAGNGVPHLECCDRLTARLCSR